MKIAVCEDDSYFAEQLKDMILDIIAENDFFEEVDIFESGEEFLKNADLYNLIFFDCRLPGMTGVEAAKELRKNNKNAVIIFVSAYPEYAVDGYEASAIRFLVKPVDKDKLRDAIKTFKDNASMECIVCFKDGSKEYFIPSTDIISIEASKKKCIVKCKNNTYYPTKSLDNFEKEITDMHFYRVHRSNLINISHIESFHDREIILSDGNKIDISLRKKTSFKKMYMSYLKKEF